MNIAIDGPSGAGKSTLAKMAARELGYIYVDTGALYRCVGLYALNAGIDTKDPEAVAGSLADIRVEMGYDDSGQRVYLNGKDVSEDIRMPEVSMAASDVSAVPAVRQFLLSLQRDMAKRYDVIMDGRDIGTVVLPDADVKIFLTASSQARAERRCRELREKGIDVKYEDVLRDIELRDKQDMEREIAPLRPADGSILLDTTDHSLQESLDLLLKKIGK